ADLLEVVRRATALVEGRARRQRVVLELDVPDGPVSVSLDPEQIQQVLVNLLLNALDAQPHGGSIQIVVNTNAHVATVRVRDAGPGMPPVVQSHLFEPFVTSKPDGVGLGLSICKRLVEAHGGNIYAENARGGAVITFTLPLEEFGAAIDGNGARAGYR